MNLLGKVRFHAFFSFELDSPGMAKMQRQLSTNHNKVTCDAQARKSSKMCSHGCSAKTAKSKWKQIQKYLPVYIAM